MPLDGVMLRAVTQELAGSLPELRIDRVLQPEKDEIDLVLRGFGVTRRLVLCAHPQYARIHYSDIAKQNPPQPPMFCMLLRKHLQSSRVTSVCQQGLDRVVTMELEGYTELGEKTTRRLVIEIMGRHSNIILVDAQGMVIDAVKRVGASLSRARQILPGLAYQAPPGDPRPNPCEMDEDAFVALLQSCASLRLEKLLTSRLQGVSPVTAREILLQAGITDGDSVAGALDDARRAALLQALTRFFGRVRAGGFAPEVRYDASGSPRDVHPFPYLIDAACQSRVFAQPSAAVEAFFQERDHSVRMQQKSASLHHLLRTQLERGEKKLALQVQELADAQAGDVYRIQGELLSASLHEVPKGASEARVIDYTDPAMKRVSIALDPALSPAQNVQKLFKRYTKARSACATLEQHIERTRKDIAYLQEQLYNLEQCTDVFELEEVRRELAEAGVVKRVSLRKSRGKAPKPSQPERFLSTTGFPILVGKNNAQNDRITRAAEGDDLWLHVKDRPGSHVIVKTGARQVDADTLQQAAILAAYYSTARASANVPVDYTLRRYVKKPGGAAPGYVIYTHQKTCVATPDAALCSALRVTEDVQA